MRQDIAKEILARSHFPCHYLIAGIICFSEFVSVFLFQTQHTIVTLIWSSTEKPENSSMYTRTSKCQPTYSVFILLFRLLGVCSFYRVLVFLYILFYSCWARMKEMNVREREWNDGKAISNKMKMLYLSLFFYATTVMKWWRPAVANPVAATGNRWNGNMIAGGYKIIRYAWAHKIL